MSAKWTVQQTSYQSYSVMCTPTTQIITFDLTALGQSPTVNSAKLLVTSTHNPTRDQFSVNMDKLKVTFRAGANVDVKSAIVAALDSGTTTQAKLTYTGFISEPMNTTNTSTVTVTLTVEIEGDAPVLDRRSTATISPGTVEFGGSVSVLIESQKPALYKHTVTYSFGNWTSSQTVEPGQTIAFSVPQAWMSELPNATTGTISIVLDTLIPQTSGGETVYVSAGTREYSATVVVPPEIKPMAWGLSWSAVNSGALANITDKLFAGASRIALSLSIASPGAYGATLQSIVFSGWGDSVTTLERTATTNVVQQAGSITLQAVVTDSRGRTATATVSTVIQNFTPPSGTFTGLERCNSDGTANPRGTAFKVNAAVTCDTTNIPGNMASASVRVRVSGGGDQDWSNQVQLQSGNNVVTVVTLAADTSYEVDYTVTDNVMSVDQYDKLRSLQYMLHFSNNGRSIGIGQVAEALSISEDGRLTVNPDWTVQFGENIYIGSQTLAEYIQSIVQGS